MADKNLNFQFVTPIQLEQTLVSNSVDSINEYAEWSSLTSYVSGERVMLLAQRKVYEAVTANTNVNPSTDLTGKWLLVGSTNGRRFFDGKIQDKAYSTSGQMTLIFAPSSEAHIGDSVCLFGLEASWAEVIVSVIDEFSVQTFPYSKLESLADNSAVIDAWTYFSSPVVRRSEMLFSDVPFLPGIAGFEQVSIQIRIGSGSGPSDIVPATIKAGEIVVGRTTKIGKVETSGSVGVTDFSKKEVDVFGNYSILPRVYSNWAEYDVSMELTKVNFAKQALTSRRSLPTVYHSGRDGVDIGHLIYGFYEELSISINSSVTATTTLRIEGLT